MQADDRNQIEKNANELLHPGSRLLFRHWEALRAERPCPTRQEISLPKLGALLPNLCILEKSQGKGWAFRLAGTSVCDLLQQNLTGKSALVGFDSFERDVVGKTLDLAQGRQQPCLVRMRMIATTNQVVAGEFLGLPLLDEASGQVLLFGGLFGFSRVEASRGLLLRRELVSTRMIWTEHENGNALMAQIGATAGPRLRVIQGGLA